jgi:hypothetical protein
MRNRYLVADPVAEDTVGLVGSPMWQMSRRHMMGGGRERVWRMDVRFVMLINAERVVREGLSGLGVWFCY